MRGGLERRSRYLLAGASVIALLAASAPEAKAQQAQDLQQIQAQIQEMQATIQALQKQVQDAKAQAAAANVAASSAGSDLDLKVKWKGAPELSSADGKFKMKIRGRVEADYANINQDTKITSFPDVSATEMRRARLGVEGVLWYDWKYILEVDFANDAVAVRDAYLQYQGFKIWDDPLKLRAGNFKTPNTLAEATTELFVDTMERPAFINAWDMDRQIGAGVFYDKEHFSLGAGIFGQRFASTVNAPLFPGFNGDEDVTFAARGTVAPINRELNGVPQALHFGASVRTRDAGNDQPFFQYGPRARGADLNLANSPINTGRIGEEDTFWGLEAAALWGPFSIQGEYGNLDVDLPTGAFIRSNPPGTTTPPSLLTTAANPFLNVSNPSYDAWYVTGSWFFGGHKVYERDGRFGRPKVDNPMFHGSGGWGALQLVGSYDVLNMGTPSGLIAPNQTIGSNGFPNAVGPCATTRLYPGLSTTTSGTNSSLQAAALAECGDMKTWIVGANWWMTEYMRLMFQYSESELSGYPTTTLVAAANGTQPRSGNVNGFDGATIRGFGMRMQVDW